MIVSCGCEVWWKICNFTSENNFYSITSNMCLTMKLWECIWSPPEESCNDIVGKLNVPFSLSLSLSLQVSKYGQAVLVVLSRPPTTPCPPVITWPLPLLSTLWENSTITVSQCIQCTCTYWTRPALRTALSTLSGCVIVLLCLQPRLVPTHRCHPR